MAWGWGPDSFEAVGTVLATVVAACSAFWAVWSSAAQSKDNRERAKRFQASQVAAWTDLRDSVPGGVDGFVIISNQSSLPVTDVRVRHEPIPSLGEGREPGMMLVWVLGPGEKVEKPIGSTSRHDALGRPGDVISTEFTDSAGLRWIRDRQGLHQAT